MQRAVDQREPPPLGGHAASSSPAGEGSAAGVSMTAFAALALVALFTARALAPALPGSATGIAFLIAGASFIAACTSQLVAAGGIALCLRLLGNAILLPGLGVAFRVLIFPVTLGVVALVVAAAARALDPNLGRVLSILCVIAPASAATLLLARGRTRAVGIVLLLGAAGAAFDLAAYESARRAALAGLEAGRSAALAALVLDAGAAVLALVWAATGRRRAAIGVGVGLFALAVALTVASATASHTAPGWHVVLERSVDGLTRRPVRASASRVADLFALFPVLVAAALLGLRGRHTELRAALALCLLGRTDTGAPAAALLSVGATLLAVPHALQEEPEQTPRKTST